MAHPWLTSNELIAAIKRKILVPTSQNLFSDTELLAFANEEMMVSQVPSVLQYHEEYFVYSEDTPLLTDITRYAIPHRAIGMRLRDLMWKDQSGNLFEMTRVDAGDKAFFQRNVGANTAISKFYLENNDVVLTPSTLSEPTGNLTFYFYLRPNTLVTDDRAAIVESFSKRITISNTLLTNGDTLTIGDQVFTAVSGSPSSNQFQIGGTSIVTATNLAAAINTNATYTASNGSPSTAIVTIVYTSYSTTFSTTNTSSFVISSQDIVNCTDTVPSNITNGSIIDILQTKPGHKMLDYDITLSSTAISGDQIIFEEDVLPEKIEVGDYICSQYECIIPMLPTDLHSGLAERTSARILAAIGDQQGLANANQKIGEIALREGTMLDARIDGAPKKVNARHTILRFNRMGTKRRF